MNWTNGKTFTWTAGRQLSGVTDANNTIAYTYDDSGIRTSKTVNGTKTDYYLNGTAIIMQKTGDQCIWYTYDESGNLSGLRVGNSEYYYYRNGQGDIIGIIDSTGSIAAKYSYDAWGTPIAITDGAGNDVSGNAAHIANVNPFRYRGYFYDVETGLYYLQSRYYDPQVGRFVNADGDISTGQGILGNNMFAYSMNNPVNMSDLTGEIAVAATLGGIALWKLGLAIAGAVGAIVVTDAIAKNPPALPPISFPRIDIKPKSETKPETRDIVPTLPKPPAKDPVHHIVAKADLRAAESRQILRDVGIEPVTDLRNLVVLPQSYHASLHTTAYHNYVTERLRAVAGDRAGVEATLASIKRQILIRSTLGIRWD